MFPKLGAELTLEFLMGFAWSFIVIEFQGKFFLFVTNSTDKYMSQLVGAVVVVKASFSQSVDLGSIPLPSHNKDFKKL